MREVEDRMSEPIRYDLNENVLLVGSVAAPTAIYSTDGTDFFGRLEVLRKAGATSLRTCSRQL